MGGELGSIPIRYVNTPSIVLGCGGGLGMGRTYARKLVPAITAFRRSALLLDVQVSEFAARGLGDADFV